MTDQNIVARNAAWLTAQPILIGVFSIVVTAFVARGLGTSNYGILLLFLSYVGLFSQISNLGMRPYSVREIAADRNRAGEIVADMLVLRFTLSLLAMIVATVFLAFTDPIMSGRLLAALFALLLFSALTGCFLDGLQGMENMRSVAGSFAVSGVITQLACVAALVLQLGLLGVVAAYICGAAVMLLMVWLQFYRTSGPFTTRIHCGRLISHLRYSWAFFLQNVVEAIRTQCNLIIINAFLGTHAAGIYGSSMVLIQRTDLIQDGITTALFSRVAYLNGKSPEELAKLVRGAMKVILVLSTPMAIGLFAVSNDVVALMFGIQYSDAGDVLAILGIGIPFTFTSGIMFNVLRAIGLQKTVLKISVWTMLLALSLFFGGIVYFDVLGAACGMVLGFATQSILLTLEYSRRFGAPWFLRDLAHIAIANLAMGGALWLVREQHFAIKFVVAVLVFASVARLLGLATPAMLKTMFAARSSR